MGEHTRIKLFGIAASVALMASGLAVGTALPAAAAGCSSGVPGDVNGDRHAEVAVNDTRGGGAVHILYGRSTGLVTDAAGRARDDQRITQDSPGVPGNAEREDRFGAVTAFGDFNDDGCADLAVSSPGENEVGSVNVIYGSPTGLSSSGVQVFSGAMFGPDPNGPTFGSALAVGDLDDDGTDDLAIGASGLDVAGASAAGGVAVLYGDADGLDRGDPAVLISRATANVPGTPAEDAFFGAQLASGDFDGDGLAELAISAPGDGNGTVQTLELGAAGVGTGQPDPFTAGDVGVPKSTTGEDRFGTALTAGDVNADSRDDLVVGIPDWNCLECDEFFGSGGVVLVRGSAAGLSGDGAQFWTQNSPGVAGVARAEDAFGYAVAIGPLDDDGYADLAVGTPQDTEFSGSVTLLRGSATGLTTSGFGGRYIDQGTAGIAGAVETGDFFGGTLTTSFIQSANQANLVIAAEGETIGGKLATGQIHQLAIGDAGPKASGSRTFHLDSPGLKGTPADNARFGRSLS